MGNLRKRTQKTIELRKIQVGRLGVLGLGETSDQVGRVLLEPSPRQSPSAKALHHGEFTSDRALSEFAFDVEMLSIFGDQQWIEFFVPASPNSSGSEIGKKVLKVPLVSLAAMGTELDQGKFFDRTRNGHLRNEGQGLLASLRFFEEGEDFGTLLGWTEWEG